MVAPVLLAYDAANALAMRFLGFSNDPLAIMGSALLYIAGGALAGREGRLRDSLTAGAAIGAIDATVGSMLSALLFPEAVAGTVDEIARATADLIRGSAEAGMTELLPVILAGIGLLVLALLAVFVGIAAACGLVGGALRRAARRWIMR